MTNKTTRFHPSRSTWKGFVWGVISSVSLLGVGGAGYLLNQQNADAEEIVAVGPERTLTTPKEFQTFAYETNISATQLQTDFDTLIGFSQEPHKEDDTSVIVFENDLTSEEEAELTHAYLDGLLMQRRKYNRMVRLLEKDIAYISSFDDIILDESTEIQNLDSPLVEAIMGEIAHTPLTLHQDEEILSVWIDYEAVSERYDGLLNDFHHNLITLHDDIMRFGYSHADGELDVEAIYQRLLLIDTIQANDRTLDDFYWEEERYQLAVLLTGYGLEERPTWDETYLSHLRNVALDKIGNPYSVIAQQLIESIKDEGEYGEDTIRLANTWMSENFEEYSKYLELNGTIN